jgi:ubiquitin-protein ligase
MNPRFRRLEADQRSLLASFAGHPHLRVEPVGPPPAQRYRVTYAVWGLHKTVNNELVRQGMHVVDITLPGGYPREKPYCTTASPIFHPNFGNYICIADFWSPSQSLVDIVVQIGDMIQFRLYNTGSPLNALAARWAAENVARLPVGDLELLPADLEIRIDAPTA